MWYARGELELCVDCFRRSLFWNPEQTATLYNLAAILVEVRVCVWVRSVLAPRSCPPIGRVTSSVLCACDRQMGLEKDGDVVMKYYDGAHGGTAGGWSPDREEALRQSIRQG
jgi:hypothetical protein